MARGVKQVTINEMIYNTLRTKNTKTPKYYDVLTALGYKLLNDTEWSVFDYWEIETKKGDRINISRGYDKRTRLYITATRVRGDYKKVDYANLIKMSEIRKGNRPFDLIWKPWAPNKRTPRIEEYFRIKDKIQSTTSIMGMYARDFQKAEEAYKKAKSDLDRATKSVIEANDAMLHFKDELHGIYRNGIDD